MFSKSHWKPSPVSAGQSIIGNYVGQENNIYRQRTSNEEFIRTLSSITPATTVLNTTSELGELWLHKDRQAQISMNNIISSQIKDTELARDAIFERCANRIP